MGKSKLAKLARGTKITVMRNCPDILVGFGIAGMVTAAVMAVRATPKAIALMEEQKEKLETDVLTPADTVKATWKCYIPAAAVGCVSIACLIGANSVNARRNAALATAYTLSETALKEYQEKVVETIGEKKEQSVRDAIAKDKIDKTPVSSNSVMIAKKGGNTLCFDALSGQYFKSDMDTLKKAENEINRRMLEEMYVSLNDFYYEVGLNCTRIGDDLGWNIDDGFMSLYFSSQLAADGTPCLVLEYHVAPRYDFSMA